MAKDARSNDKSAQSRGLNRRGGQVADWAKADANLVLRAITSAALQHGALRFGYTSDGGAYSIGIYGDGDPYTEYVRPSENLDEILMAIIELFDSMG